MPDIKFLSDYDFFTLIKSGKDITGYGVRKGFLIEEKKDFGDETRTIEFVISTPIVDRMRDTIDVMGWNLENYQKNPVVLWAHDYRQPPIARSLTTWIENGKLKSKCEFTSQEKNPFGYMIYQLYKDGFMNATSVGFYPAEYVINEERQGIDYKSQELLEYSCVPVPANPEALVSAKSMGIDLLPLKSWAEQVLDTWNEDKGIWIPKKDIETVFALLNKKTYSTPTGEKKEDPRQEAATKTPITKPQGGGWDETEESWRYRVRDPENFIPDSFRTKEIDTGVKAVFGKLKSDGENGPMKTQTIIFDKETFSKKADAEKWLKEHEDLTKEDGVIFIKYLDTESMNKIGNELMDVCKELNIEGLAIDCTTSHELIRLIKEEIINIKAGRVLSEKNRNLIQSCVLQMQEAIEALNQLLSATEPQDDEDSKEFTLDDEESSKQKSIESTLNDEEIDLDSISNEEKNSSNSPDINADDAKEILGKLIDEKLRKLTGKLD